MSKTQTRTMRKIGFTVGLVAVMASLVGTYAAFTATTSNDNNTFVTGSVALSDNDGGSTPLYLRSDAKPGDASVGCIAVTFTGSLSSAVKLYTGSSIANGSDFTLQVERGTQSTGTFPACGDFSPTSTAYAGDLGTFASTHSGWGSGLDAKAGGAAWSQNDVVAYRFTVTQKDEPTANARTAVRSSGTHTFTWEARNE